MPEVSFAVTPADAAIIAAIVDRAIPLAKEAGIKVKRMDLIMDLEAVHANGNPLRLADLLAADPGNFGHDVWGIRRYLDRETGQLTSCFLPRFSVPQEL